jgi:hypothetical protein
LKVENNSERRKERLVCLRNYQGWSKLLDSSVFSIVGANLEKLLEGEEEARGRGGDVEKKGQPGLPDHNVLVPLYRRQF